MENELKIGDKIKWHNPLLGKRFGVVTRADETGIYVTTPEHVKYHIRPDNIEKVNVVKTN